MRGGAESQELHLLVGFLALQYPLQQRFGIRSKGGGSGGESAEQFRKASVHGHDARLGRFAQVGKGLQPKQCQGTQPLSLERSISRLLRCKGNARLPIESAGCVQRSDQKGTGGGTGTAQDAVGLEAVQRPSDAAEDGQVGRYRTAQKEDVGAAAVVGCGKPADGAL